jgi:hypothetical protein
MKELLTMELDNLIGNDETYGLIEEIQDEIVNAILPVSQADR